MNAPKQTTLFTSWGPRENHGTHECDVEFEDDDIDDEELFAAAMALDNNQFDEGTRLTTLDPNLLTPSRKGNDVHDEILPGFDISAGNLWIYPTNYPVRDYQFNIVQQSLFKNTMVTLPTGLGKTFIAAVVMYNFYRWYPQGKIAFMAPTKPLVAQQIEACYNIMGIPREHTAEMTGSMVPSERLKAWKNKRVFFLTPQVLMNDLNRGAAVADQLKCLVIDEAHKALGNHAYCQVVRELSKYTRQFRILALSATPGCDIKGVQQVLNTLLISHVEIRTEDSIDIQPYVHQRKVDKIVVKLDDTMMCIKSQYLEIIAVYVNRLTKNHVLYNRSITSHSKFMILKAREEFRCNPPPNIKSKIQQGSIEGDFAMCISLYHGYDLLLQHGMKSLYSFLQSLIDGSKGTSRARSELGRNQNFNSLLESLHEQCGSTELNQCVISHPKMKKLQDIVVEHFNQFEQDKHTHGSGTRIMIFSQYRDSVQDITSMLDKHKPMVRVMSFIGQASAGKSTKGFTQKEQLRVVKAFREGGYNTLVSTCVGEEGLDIGDVDLIICYDAHKSPIRLVQRMGRTGRKRQGRIVMLVTEGKEESIYNQSQYNRKSIHRLMNGTKSLQLYSQNARMVPRGIHPVVHKMHITVDKWQPKTLSKRKQSSTRNTANITSFLSKGKTKIKDRWALTDQELEYWTTHYKCSSQVPHIPTGGRFMSLSQKSEPLVSK
ncbi:Fanconi anemia group M protein-like, partial [Saccoglossus kowalevskii]|uniref:Fanconi anemia group M protein-like n=1 Tax=Saccoglossus kowalevskii TaxID=10224 RepID=A0ABM0M082_SACKO